ncbi:glycosyltransferase [Pseudomonas nabeulensis]|uniref:Glycosyltransferase n=1 Tax=Pseudomonas nabeulensis TaxID=2293833 RepID=A0A4Z0ANM6_9PSED|nr:glycosyltransferase [Pseudomonas nabeulensis]
MNLSLIVPVFNEDKAVVGFYHAVRREPSLQVHRVEIVFVNDGSEVQ